MSVASRITLFRGPLMRVSRGDALMDGVRETLDHEVAHYLGSATLGSGN